MANHSPQQLSDREPLEATVRVASAERRTTVELLELLAELDARRLYLGEGCSSLFTYCTQVLHLSEHAAYHRIEAARAARQFPVILRLLADGAVTLTTVALLRTHLTSEGHVGLLEAASYKSKREVEHQIACLRPRPDVAPLVRRVTTAPHAVTQPAALDLHADPEPESPGARPTVVAARSTTVPKTSAVIAPLAESSYLLKVTISAETHRKLRRAQDLMRHTLPNGDLAPLLDRALTMLLDRLERTKTGKTQGSHSRLAAEASPHRRKDARYVPAAVKRAVWARDQGRCAFEGPQGRCTETGHLEFHHRVPFATGGPTEASNLALRCRAHNRYESEQLFGPFVREVGDSTRSGPS